MLNFCFFPNELLFLILDYLSPKNYLILRSIDKTFFKNISYFLEKNTKIKYTIFFPISLSKKSVLPKFPFCHSLWNFIDTIFIYLTENPKIEYSSTWFSKQQYQLETYPKTLTRVRQYIRNNLYRNYNIHKNKFQFSQKIIIRSKIKEHDNFMKDYLIPLIYREISSFL